MGWLFEVQPTLTLSHPLGTQEPGSVVVYCSLEGTGLQGGKSQRKSWMQLFLSQKCLGCYVVVREKGTSDCCFTFCILVIFLIQRNMARSSPINMIIGWMWILLLSVGLVSADIKLQQMSKTYDASSGNLVLKWTESATFPPMKELDKMVIVLLTGPNSKMTAVTDLAKSMTPSQIQKGSLTVDLSQIAPLGANGPYFIQVNTFLGAGQAMYYTDRFELTGMTGTLPASGSGDPPADTPLIPPNSLVLSMGKIPYASQTGPIKYAPMQMQPGTTVTKPLQLTQRLPTSAVTYFTAFRPSPSVLTTITPGWSYTFTTHTNYASTNGKPTQWRTASAVQASSIAAKTASKQKRWAI